MSCVRVGTPRDPRSRQYSNIHDGLHTTGHIKHKTIYILYIGTYLNHELTISRH